jgi:hypothetical protein
MSRSQSGCSRQCPNEIPRRRHVTSDAFYESTSISRLHTECAYGLLAHEIETAALSYHPRTASIGVADYMYLPGQPWDLEALTLFSDSTVANVAGKEQQTIDVTVVVYERLGKSSCLSGSIPRTIPRFLRRRPLSLPPS